MMWDQVFNNYDVAYPLWKQLFVGEKLEVTSPSHIGALEPEDKPTYEAIVKNGGKAQLTVQGFRKERFYTASTALNAPPSSNVSLHYSRIVQSSTQHYAVGFTRETCAWVCAYVKARHGDDCGWWVFVGGRRDNSFSLDDHYCGFRRALSPFMTTVRYLTYQEQGSAAHAEGVEMGHIGAEYVPNVMAWINQTKALGIDPEDLFRRVDFGEFSTKAARNDWAAALVCAPPLPQNELTQNCWDYDSQGTMLGKQAHGCTMKYRCAPGFANSANYTAYSMCLPRYKDA
jgi:hypothetical protein